MDETQDIAKHEQVLHYVADDFTAKERFLGFYRVTKTDGESLYNLILTVFNKFQLNIENVVAQCYDGASNMCGGYKGVATRVKNVNNKAIYVHCCGHVLNLAFVDTTKEITLIRNTLGTISQLHNFIDGSAKRHAVFENLQKEAGYKTLTLKSLSDTRWSCRAEAFRAVKKRLEEIMNTLEEIADSDVSCGSQAEGLLKAISTFDFVFNLYILDVVFNTTNILSKYLQSVNVSICSALESTHAVLQSLKDMRNEEEFEKFWKEATDTCNKLNLPDPCLPRQRRIPAKQGGGRRRSKFYIYQCEALLSNQLFLSSFRYINFSNGTSENDLSIARDVEEILVAQSLLSVSDAAIKRVSSFYGFDEDDIKAELRVFTNLVKDKEISLLQNTSTGSIILCRKQLLAEDNGLKTVLPVVTKLMKIFWTIPINSCSAEHSFSCLRHLKTYLRSTMGQERLSSLGFLYIERGVVIDMDNVVNDFAKTSRRLNLL